MDTMFGGAYDTYRNDVVSDHKMHSMSTYPRAYELKSFDHRTSSSGKTNAYHESLCCGVNPPFMVQPTDHDAAFYATIKESLPERSYNDFLQSSFQASPHQFMLDTTDDRAVCSMDSIPPGGVNVNKNEHFLSLANANRHEAGVVDDALRFVYQYLVREASSPRDTLDPCSGGDTTGPTLCDVPSKRHVLPLSEKRENQCNFTPCYDPCVSSKTESCNYSSSYSRPSKMLPIHVTPRPVPLNFVQLCTNHSNRNPCPREDNTLHPSSSSCSFSHRFSVSPSSSSPLPQSSYVADQEKKSYPFYTSWNDQDVVSKTSCVTVTEKIQDSTLSDVSSGQNHVIPPGLISTTTPQHPRAGDYNEMLISSPNSISTETLQSSTELWKNHMFSLTSPSLGSDHSDFASHTGTQSDVSACYRTPPSVSGAPSSTRPSVSIPPSSNTFSDCSLDTAQSSSQDTSDLLVDFLSLDHETFFPLERDAVSLPSECVYNFDAKLTVSRAGFNQSIQSSTKQRTQTGRSSAEFLCSFPGVSWNTRMQSWLVYYEDITGRKSKTFNPKRYSSEKLSRLGVRSEKLRDLNSMSLAMHCACAFATKARYRAKLYKQLGLTVPRSAPKMQKLNTTPISDKNHYTGTSLYSFHSPNRKDRKQVTDADPGSTSTPKKKIHLMPRECYPVITKLQEPSLLPVIQDLKKSVNVESSSSDPSFLDNMLSTQTIATQAYSHCTTPPENKIFVWPTSDETSPNHISPWGNHIKTKPSKDLPMYYNYDTSCTTLPVQTLNSTFFSQQPDMEIPPKPWINKLHDPMSFSTLLRQS